MSVTDEASDFKFVRQLGLPRLIIKSHSEEKVGVALGQGSSPKFGGSRSIFTQWPKVATSKLARCYGLSRPIIKFHTEEKVHVALG